MIGTKIGDLVVPWTP